MARAFDATASALPAIWVDAAGRPVVLRALQDDDETRLGDFVRGLSPASRYNRFHNGLRELPPPWLQALMRFDPARELALLALSGERGRALCIAEARYAQDLDCAGGREFALVVADGWHGRGLGAELLRRLLAHARERGVERMSGDVLSTNAAMLRLAGRAGFRVAPHHDDARLRRVTRRLEPDRPAAGTMIEATSPLDRIGSSGVVVARVS